MKTAMEQFVELGYEVRDHNFLELPNPIGWTTQDEPTLTYFQASEFGREVIVFHGFQKYVTVEAVLNDRGRLPAPLRPKEIEAIHAQLVELEWLEDADPVVHAHWSTKEGGPYCTRCNEDALWDDRGGSWLTEYCPNCGAKMDEEVAE